MLWHMRGGWYVVAHEGRLVCYWHMRGGWYVVAHEGRLVCCGT